MFTPHRNASSALVPVAAVLALSLTACAADGAADDDSQPTVTATQEVGPSPTEGTEGAADGATEAPESTPAGGNEEVYQAVDAVMAEYAGAVVLEFDAEFTHFEFEILYDGSEWDLEVDRETYEIRMVEQDSPDSDDQRKAEAVEIELVDALRTAAEEGDGTVVGADLDTENDTVVWEIDLDNGLEVYVDVATGAVVKVDR